MKRGGRGTWNNLVIFQSTGLRILLTIIGCPSARGSLGISSAVPSRSKISFLLYRSSRTFLSIQDVPYVFVLLLHKWDVPIGIGRYPSSILLRFRRFEKDAPIGIGCFQLAVRRRFARHVSIGMGRSLFSLLDAYVSSRRCLSIRDALSVSFFFRLPSPPLSNYPTGRPPPLFPSIFLRPICRLSIFSRETKISLEGSVRSQILVPSPHVEGGLCTCEEVFLYGIVTIRHPRHLERDVSWGSSFRNRSPVEARGSLWR